MGIFKIVVVALMTLFLTLFIKEIKPEMAIYVSLAGGMIITLMSLSLLGDIVEDFKNIMKSINIDEDIFKTLFKIVAIGYITEFSSSVCRDCQNNLLADKIIFGGKIIIFAISIPIIKSIVNIISGLV